VFRQIHQRHSCGTGSREELLEGKPESLVQLYVALEKTLTGWKGVEIVMRGRYALFRTTRIFADLVFMKDALRIAIVLDGQVTDPMFFKSEGMSRHRVIHVAKVRTAAELKHVKPYLKRAHRFALSDRPKARKPATPIQKPKRKPGTSKRTLKR
jgi:hypothetical protein